MNTDLPIVFADMVHNLYSALNHVAVRLVPSTHRRSVAFPFFWQGVWDDRVPGENRERVKDRERWLTYTRHMPDSAVAILKSLQPPDDDSAGESAFWLLNKFANRDRHNYLVVAAYGFRDCFITYTTSDGRSHRRAYGRRDTNTFVAENNAQIGGLPVDAVNVNVEGAVLVSLEIRHQQAYTDHITEIGDVLVSRTEATILDLLPYVR